MMMDLMFLYIWRYMVIRSCELDLRLLSMKMT